MCLPGFSQPLLWGSLVTKRIYAKVALETPAKIYEETDLLRHFRLPQTNACGFNGDGQIYRGVMRPMAYSWMPICAGAGRSSP